MLGVCVGIFFLYRGVETTNKRPGIIVEHDGDIEVERPERVPAAVGAPYHLVGMRFDKALPCRKVFFQERLVVLEVRKEFLFRHIMAQEPHIAVELVHAIKHIRMALQYLRDMCEVLPAAFSVRDELVAVPDEIDVRVCRQYVFKAFLLTPTKVKIYWHFFRPNDGVYGDKPRRIGRKLRRALRSAVVTALIETNFSVSFKKTGTHTEHLRENICCHCREAVRPVVSVRRHEKRHKTVWIPLHGLPYHLNGLRDNRLPDRKKRKRFGGTFVIHHADIIRHGEIDPHRRSKFIRRDGTVRYRRDVDMRINHRSRIGPAVRMALWRGRACFFLHCGGYSAVPYLRHKERCVCRYLPCGRLVPLSPHMRGARDEQCECECTEQVAFPLLRTHASIISYACRHCTPA